MSPGLMGQHEFRHFSLFMPALLLPTHPLLPPLNSLTRPFALAVCDGFMRRYYQEGLLLQRGEERRGEEKKRWMRHGSKKHKR